MLQLAKHPRGECGIRKAECGIPHPVRRHRGFTLLELVLVLVIAATALAMAAPSLRGWRRGAALRGSMEELLMLTRLARTESITKGKIYRLEFSEDMAFQLKMQDRSLVAQQQQQGPGMAPAQNGLAGQLDSAGFVPIPGEFGRVYKLPEGTKLEIEKMKVLSDYEVADAKVIDFYPTGRTQPVTISVTDAQNFQVVIQCSSPAGNFRWVSEGTKN